MADDDKPGWPHKTPEETARWLISGCVTEISHHWQFTSADTSENWIEMHRSDGQKRRFASGFLQDNSEFEFAPDHARLVNVRPHCKIAATIMAIDAWERKHARELAEYKRLKAKFGGRE